VFFADLPYDGAIAVCIVYYINVGPPNQRRILEFDLVFDADLIFVDNLGNEYDFSWGDATLVSEYMDLENIATHETAPVPEQTMYGYARAGETKKRSLEAGDIAGIAALYG